MVRIFGSPDTGPDGFQRQGIAGDGGLHSSSLKNTDIVVRPLFRFASEESRTRPRSNDSVREPTTEIYAVETVCVLLYLIVSLPSKNRRLGDFNNHPLLKVVASEKLNFDWTV